jgi:hypothetical protein
MATAKNAPEPNKPRRPPATTLESREMQMVALAVDLAERQLSDGTASAQVITHYLKLGTTRERLEQEKLTRENQLLSARAEALAGGQRIEELYTEAIAAMRNYAGIETPVDDED